MKIVNRNINELIPAEYNPRVLTDKEYKDIKQSLKEFGLVDPVIVNMHKDRKNIIVGGHQRVKIWSDLGNDTIPTVEVILPFKKEQELNVRLNKNTGQFDYDILANMFETDELIDWGFEEWEFGIDNSEESTKKETVKETKLTVKHRDLFELENLESELIGRGFDCKIA